MVFVSQAGPGTRNVSGVNDLEQFLRERSKDMELIRLILEAIGTFV